MGLREFETLFQRMMADRERRALAAQGGTGGTHPVTKPDFTLSYENKDITGDIAPYLISFVYTDYLEGQSDELQVEFEDVDGRWLRGWYPEQGDALSLSLPADTLKAAALRKTLAYEQLAAHVAGQRQALQSKIEAAKKQSDLDKIKIAFSLPEAV